MIFNTPYQVVIIDDDNDTLNLIKNILLRSFPDLYVKSFERYEEALEYIESNLVHIVICDIHIGQVSGLEVMRELLALEKGLQLIALSADHSIMTGLECFNIGVSYFLDKPINQKRLSFVLSHCIANLNDWHELIAEHLDESRDAS